MRGTVARAEFLGQQSTEAKNLGLATALTKLIRYRMSRGEKGRDVVPGSPHKDLASLPKAKRPWSDFAPGRA
jgi:hypothetical protein